MTTNAKLSAEQRRAAILKAVRRVFAEKGFHGTTTRALAEAAGVSEALLFKHFPNKGALFSAMQEECCSEQDIERFQRLKALEPSAATLVLLVHFLVSLLVRGGSRPEEQASHDRLILRSLAEDGEFARLMHRILAEEWIPKVRQCLQQAVACGEAHEGPSAVLGAWFAHNLAALIKFHLLPSTPVVDYGVSREELARQAVWFALRGLGLTEEAIRRHYHPEALALLGA